MASENRLKSWPKSLEKRQSDTINSRTPAEGTRIVSDPDLLNHLQRL